MECARCKEKFNGLLEQEGDKVFCSMECADLASGIVPEENENYVEEAAPEGFNEEDE